jgi:chromosomal replication initiation ATPase DnaA
LVFDELLPELSAEEKSRVLQPVIELKEITHFVATSYEMAADDLLRMSKGPNSGNALRKIAMYLCQMLSGTALSTIADHFNLSHAGSVSYITHEIRQKMLVDSGFKRKVESLISGLAIKAT